MRINNEQVKWFIDAYHIIHKDGGRYYCNGKSYTDNNGKYHMGSVTEFKKIFADEIRQNKPPFNQSLSEGCGSCIRASVRITIEELLKNNIISDEQLK